MIKLDDDLLAELGLGALSPEEKKKLLAHIYETLEMRVGMKLAEQMSDAQLAEFEQFIKVNDEAGALQWLETNFPHYKDVVASEFENLKGEIGHVAPQILAAGSQNPAAAPAPGPLPASPVYGSVDSPNAAMPPAPAYVPQSPQQSAVPSGDASYWPAGGAAPQQPAQPQPQMSPQPPSVVPQPYQPTPPPAAPAVQQPPQQMWPGDQSSSQASTWAPQQFQPPQQTPPPQQPPQQF